MDKRPAKFSCWPTTRRSKLLCIIICTVTVIALAIGLGVGLGVGLKHRHHPPKVTATAFCSNADGSFRVANLSVPVQQHPAASSPLLTSPRKNYLNITAWNLTVDDTPSGYKQVVAGFGATVTDATVSTFNSQPNATQYDILRKLVTSAGANFTLMRHTIGSSDLSSEAYTYDDNRGKTDNDLSNFSLGSQGTAMAQLLAQMKQLNNDIQIVGSPWSPPGWMKINGELYGNTTDNNLDDGYGSSRGLGSTGHTHAFAQYFVKYIQAYANLGVPIDAISIQNEPLNSQAGYPTMYIEADESGKLINEYVGPALKNANLSTTVWALDDNTDDADYAYTVMDYAANYIDAVAWHCYASSLNWTVLTEFHNQYPNISQYMTECWTPNNLSWTHVVNFTMGPLQNWANGITAWTLGTNDNAGPHLDSGGCSTCDGIVSVNSTGTRNSANSNSTDYTFNFSYYVMAQFSKFIPSGARILQTQGSAVDSNGDGIQAIASLNPDGSRTVVIENMFGNDVNVTVWLGSDGSAWMGNVPNSSVTTWVLP
ncbi:glucosylceramidase, putative [Talaromyces stipitatus ATCC 10500]|uniref:glucan endo-1,6-beta-glucosidase n=1 Tax=Talaromyces stipitatus (strain ATCC 10500 / CBS 375.48 / QM 6759 / NRRL 1006) TaxID=441959 RepID=B8M152_TALSN|nr:glucosylceramidase, putative [Talaromyces stipitatus ATCC 10500]EED20994.1 glucosylceramidase, putative [Talaromyces stipitatus ATCC 10500]